MLISVSGEPVNVEDEKIKTSKDKLPVDTEKIIQQAEETLEKKEEKIVTSTIDKKKRQSFKCRKTVISIKSKQKNG